MRRQVGRGAPLAREIRLLVAPTLGSWPKVLQLSVLTLVGAGALGLLIAASSNGWITATMEMLSLR